jgi:UDP-N-acetylglucosamine--N-acetylmuramyl-(pentapeptide) pyrophosphoryl-undecaprenol N-acetylglucosamine transferase
MAELGVQGRACIVIPNPLLTGGHQTKNAEKLAEQGAAVVVKESTLSKDPEELGTIIRRLLGDEKERLQLGKHLRAHTIPDAANKVAMLLLEVGAQK